MPRSTVTVAAKNRMELAMGIAVGSSTQIALLVIPSLTLAGWALGQDMTLEFPPIEVGTVLAHALFVRKKIKDEGPWKVRSFILAM